MVGYMVKSIYIFLKDNLFSLITVAVGVIVLILSQLNLLPVNTLEPTILALVVFLATSQLVDNGKKLNLIHDAVVHGTQDTIKSLNGVSIIPLAEPENGLHYLALRIRDAKAQLDLVSLSPKIPRDNIGARDWEKAIERVLLANQIRFRYICNFNDETRFERVRKHLVNPRITKFFVGCYHVSSNSVPMPNFLIVDNDEVIVIFPYSIGEPEMWLSIKHPEIVRSYERYFRRLWDDSTKIASGDAVNGNLSKFHQLDKDS